MTVMMIGQGFPQPEERVEFLGWTTSCGDDEAKLLRAKLRHVQDENIKLLKLTDGLADAKESVCGEVEDYCLPTIVSEDHTLLKVHGHDFPWIPNGITMESGNKRYSITIDSVFYKIKLIEDQPKDVMP